MNKIRICVPRTLISIIPLKYRTALIVVIYTKLRTIASTLCYLEISVFL